MNELILLLVVILLMFLIDIKYVIIICFIIYLIKSDPKIKNIIEKKIKSENTKTKYNSEIDKILDKLKKYKKNFKNQYSKGINYWKLFIKMLHKLEDDNLENYNQYLMG